MNTPPIGSNWDDLEREIFTAEEISKSNRRAAIISERIRARKEADSGRLKPIQTAPNLPPSPHRQSQTPHG